MSVALLLPAAVLLASSVAIVGQASKQQDGTYAYDMPEVVLWSEMLKLACSLCFLLREQPGMHLRAFPWRQAWKFTLPAFLYTITNNLWLLALAVLGAAVDQVMGNMKLFFSGFLLRVMMGRDLSSRQWTALVILAVGCSYMSLADNTPSEGLQMSRRRAQALLLHLVYSAISAFAGVFTQLLYQAPVFGSSLHLKNSLLYTCGVALNSGAIAWRTMGSKNPATWTPFVGWNPLVCVLVVLLGGQGLVISAIFVHFGVLDKCLTSAASIVLSSLFSALLFHFPITTVFLLGAALVITSLFLYHYQDQDQDRNQPALADVEMELFVEEGAPDKAWRD